MADSLSGFFFDVLKWRSSKSVQRMSFAERGVYLEMMCEQWDKRFLPDSPDAVADLIAMTSAQVAEVLASWAIVRAKFVTDERHPDRIYNARLERTRRQQRANYKRRREAGHVAGKASAAKRQTPRELPINESLTIVQRSSTEEKRREESREVLKRAGAEIAEAEALVDRARSFVERYPRIYADCRNGAGYRIREARDFPAFEELTVREPDDTRLDALLKLFLTVKSRDFLNVPGTPRQFLHMLPECDRLLRENGR